MLVGRSHWRGDLLDGAALAAQELGRPDLSKRLEAAWRAAPTLTRLLRWLVVDGHELEPLRKKATRALARCPKTAARQIGLLRVLLGDVTGAAALLSKAPGLGWSNPDHPGHTMFPLLAMLLSNGTIDDALVTALDATGRDLLESLAMTGEEHKPKLTTPSMVALIQDSRAGIAVTDANRDTAVDAMRIAAEKRVAGSRPSPMSSPAWTGTVVTQRPHSMRRWEPRCRVSIQPKDHRIRRRSFAVTRSE